MRFELHEEIEAKPSRVWSSLVDPDALARWFGPHMTLDARPEGGFREIWHDGDREIITSGRIVSFEDGRRLAMTWADADWSAQTNVEIRVEPRGAGTCVFLVHAGWERLGDAGPELMAAHQEGWRYHLANLRLYAEEAHAQGRDLANEG